MIKVKETGEKKDSIKAKAKEDQYSSRFNV